MTRRPLALAAALASGIVLALGAGNLAEPVSASSPRAKTPDRQCFLPRQVSGYHPLDDDTVDVEIGSRIVYRLELFGTCPDVDWSHRIGIRATHGASWVCQDHQAELLVPGPMGVDRCQVTSVRRLSDEEVAALRKDRKRR
jgi:hypothetical protein